MHAHQENGALGLPFCLSQFGFVFFVIFNLVSLNSRKKEKLPGVGLAPTGRPVFR